LGALDDGMWCLTSPGYAQTVIDWLDLYTFAEEITVEDRSATTFQLTLAGPTASSVLASFAGLALDEIVRREIAGASVVVWRRLAGGADGYEVIGDAGDRDAVLAALVGAGVPEVSTDAWEGFRVANGMPAIDAEFGLFNNPLEARLLGAISETKGCYTGQEVIARLQTYDKVQRTLMSVELDAPVEVGTALEADGKRVGALTSVVSTDDGVRGLALVASRAAIAGATLTAGDANAVLREPAYALATEPRET
jgi:folate-binding protein YgfZ